jgi:hypothetical protein
MVLLVIQKTVTKILEGKVTSLLLNISTTFLFSSVVEIRKANFGFCVLCYAQTSPLRHNGRYSRICFANIDVDASLLLSHSEHAYATTLNGARYVGSPKKSEDFLGKRQNKIATIVFLRKT